MTYHLLPAAANLRDNTGRESSLWGIRKGNLRYIASPGRLCTTPSKLPFSDRYSNFQAVNVGKGDVQNDVDGVGDTFREVKCQFGSRGKAIYLHCCIPHLFRILQLVI